MLQSLPHVESDRGFSLAHAAGVSQLSAEKMKTESNRSDVSREAVGRDPVPRAVHITVQEVYRKCEVYVNTTDFKYRGLVAPRLTSVQGVCDREPNVTCFWLPPPDGTSADADATARTRAATGSRLKSVS